MVWTPHTIAFHWTTRTGNKIQRANLSGSGLEDLVTAGLQDPRGIPVDTNAEKMYWVDAGTNKIQRANLDGSGVQDLVTGLNPLWESRWEPAEFIGLNRAESGGPTLTARAWKTS